MHSAPSLRLSSGVTDAASVWRESRPASIERYRADIDGLRALAVLAVVLFHARVGGFSGGFVGVDIFYVISGYLITSLIVHELDAGSFSLIRFYERRIRRIFPALFGMLLLCTMAACLLLIPKDLQTFACSIIAATVFASNIFFKRQASSDEGYFSRGSESQPLLHTWSLAIEEQFYLLFPLTLMLFVRHSKRRAAQAVGCGCAISFFLSIWTAKTRPVAAFYILAPRAWELLVGSLIALKVVSPIRSRALRELAGFTGMGLIVWAIGTFAKDTTFPGINALFPCLGAALIIVAGEDGPSHIRRALSIPQLVFVGLISYSLYLWHWPVLVLARYFFVGDLNPVETGVCVLTAGGLATLSYHFVEKPFRRNTTVSRRQVFAFGLAASTVSLAFGAGILASRGIPGRYEEATSRLVAANVLRTEDYEEVCGNWKTAVRSIRDIKICQLGPDLVQKVLFWGDSHVQQLFPVIKSLHDRGLLHDPGVLTAIENGCPPAEHLNSREGGYHCDSFAQLAMTRAMAADVDTVFIGFNTWWSVHQDLCPSMNGVCTGELSLGEVRDHFLNELAEHVTSLKECGKRVIVSLPFPMYDKSIPDVEIRDAIFGRFGLHWTASDITLPSFRADIAAVAQRTGARIFDPRKSLCRDDGCVTEIDGVSIYKDDNHIAASQIGILEPELEAVLR